MVYLHHSRATKVIYLRTAISIHPRYNASVRYYLRKISGRKDSKLLRSISCVVFLSSSTLAVQLASLRLGSTDKTRHCRRSQWQHHSDIPLYLWRATGSRTRNIPSRSDIYLLYGGHGCARMIIVHTYYCFLCGALVVRITTEFYCALKTVLSSCVKDRRSDPV